MNWEALGAIGETLGAVAVLVTLGYLAVQVRYAKDEVRRSASVARSEARRYDLATMSEPHTLALAMKAEIAEGRTPSPFEEYAMSHWGMTAEEAYLLAMRNYSAWQTRLQLIGVVDELAPHEAHNFEREILRFYGQSNMQKRFWELGLKPFEHPDVVRYIESVLAKASSH